MIRWFIEHPIAANILMALIIIAGTLSLMNVKTEVIPSVEVDWLQVILPFPGLSSEMIERQDIELVERQMLQLAGVDEVNTSIGNGQAVFQVMLSPNSRQSHLAIKSDIRALLNDIVRPSGAPSPSVFQMKIEPAVAALAIFGPSDYQDLETLALSLKRKLEALPQIGSTHFYYPADRETTIVLMPNALAQFNLTAGQVAQTLRQSRQAYDLGGVQEQGATFRMTTKQSQRSQALVSDVGNPVVRTLPNGREIFLDDVAQVVKPGFQHGHRLNGQNAVLIAVKSSNQAGLVDVSEALSEFIQVQLPSLPKGVSLDLWQDTSKYFKARIQLLIENGFYGFILLFIILAIALHWRLAFWVCLGLVVAFLGGFFILWAAGFTLNMVSLFAFILVLGVLVDDAIIVGDSVYSSECTVVGVQQVAKPVVVAALTTMMMFVPLLFLPGDEGRMLRVIPAVVIATLVFSLFESLFILPAHLRHLKEAKASQAQSPFLHSTFVQQSYIYKKLVVIKLILQQGVQAALAWLLRQVRWSCKNPWNSQAFFVGLFIVFGALVASGQVQYSFFAKIESDLAVAIVTMQQGSSQNQLDSILNTLESEALKIQTRNNADATLPNIKHVLRKHLDATASGQLTGQVALEMSTEASRETPAQTIALEWRSKVTELPFVDSLQIQTSLNPTQNTADFYLTSYSRDSLERAADKVGHWLQQQPEVEYVEKTGAGNEPQIEIELNPTGTSLGLTLENLAQQVRVVTANETLFNLQLDMGPSPVRLGVFSAQGIESSAQISRLPITTATGATVQLGDVAFIRQQLQKTQLDRHHAMPSAKITLHLDPNSDWNSRPWRQDVEDVVDQYFPDVTFKSGLYQQEKTQIEQYLGISFLVALLCMYGLMAVLLGSYWQPLIILYAVPFGLVGAILGHWFLGMSFTLYSLIGAFAVSGIVVNDNLVLLDAYQNQQSKSLEAIVDVVQRRVRPVLLTTLTTVVGMLPLILESSIQSQFLRPMAVSLAFGITTATTITLFLVPATLALLVKPSFKPRAC